VPALLRRRSAHGSVSASSAQAAIEASVFFAAPVLPILVLVAVFSSNVPVYGTHNSVAVFFFGWFLCFAWGVVMSKIGKRIIGAPRATDVA
jgi:hypothetical protein